MQSAYAEFEKRDVQILAISIDNTEDSAELAEALALSYPLLSDPDAKTIEAYGLVHEDPGLGLERISRPATLLLDGDGRVVYRFVPDNWRVRIRPETLLERLDFTAPGPS